jgi:hypothetical protein
MSSTDPDLLDNAAGLLEEVIEAGSDPEKNATAIASFLDDLVDLEAVLPEPVGGIAEEFDGTFFEGIITWLIKAFRVDPVAKAARKARRAERKAARRARRAERRASR